MFEDTLQTTSHRAEAAATNNIVPDRQEEEESDDEVVKLATATATKRKLAEEAYLMREESEEDTDDETQFPLYISHDILAGKDKEDEIEESTDDDKTASTNGIQDESKHEFSEASQESDVEVEKAEGCEPYFPCPRKCSV